MTRRDAEVHQVVVNPWVARAPRCLYVRPFQRIRLTSLKPDFQALFSKYHFSVKLKLLEIALYGLNLLNHITKTRTKGERRFTVLLLTYSSAVEYVHYLPVPGTFASFSKYIV